MRQANTFGQILTVTSFGESRSEALGVVIDGCPAGLTLSEEDFATDLKTRKPKEFFETSRLEDDKPIILSGVYDGHTLGTPIAVIVKNKVKNTKNYDDLKHIFRPGHADMGWQAKFGLRDFRGGGRSSGRETLSRVLAATVAKKILVNSGITCKAVPLKVAGLDCEIDGSFTYEILRKLKELKESGNSCGGIVRCEITGVPAGLGEPVFSKLDAELAKSIMSVGAVKAIGFGAGFDFAKMDGLNSNEMDKNYNGGIIGGISTGESIFFNVAVKPVPSIAIEQDTIDDMGNKVRIKIKGQHDVCLVRRICPVLKAMCELVMADFYLLSKINCI